MVDTFFECIGHLRTSAWNLSLHNSSPLILFGAFLNEWQEPNFVLHKLILNDFWWIGVQYCFLTWNSRQPRVDYDLDCAFLLFNGLLKNSKQTIQVSFFCFVSICISSVPACRHLKVTFEGEMILEKLHISSNSTLSMVCRKVSRVLWWNQLFGPAALYFPPFLVKTSGNGIPQLPKYFSGHAMVFVLCF